MDAADFSEKKGNLNRLHKEWKESSLKPNGDNIKEFINPWFYVFATNFLWNES